MKLDRLVSLNKFTLTSLISVSLISGLFMVLMAMVIVDAVGTAYTVSTLFVERFRTLMSDGMATAFSLIIGALFSIGVMVTILVFSLQKKLAPASTVVSFAGGGMSFIGLMMIILPDTVTLSMVLAQPMLLIKMSLVCLMAFLPAYITRQSAKSISEDEILKRTIQESNRQIIEDISYWMKEGIRNITNGRETEITQAETTVFLDKGSASDPLAKFDILKKKQA
ncbi:hypothetical protein [Algivirga pacifica]|uniref:Uncharacterized protein n=1 Tax=Algivirga pacifica TaxID=1162670 RepID=A0ABP9DQI8_9BACT